MDAYRVSENDVDLPSLIDRVAAGEQVVFTRKGQVVAGLHALTPPETVVEAGLPKHKTLEAQEAWRRLAELRDSLPPLPAGMSSVDLINEMREEREEAICSSISTRAR